MNGILYGIKPVVIAVILQALWNLSRQSLGSKTLISLAVVVLGFALAGADEIALILFAGLVYAFLKQILTRQGPPVSLASVEILSISALFYFFLKVGALLYGSGYVLIAYLRSGLVEKASVLTEAQLLDAVAVGQVTPGPVFTTATFVGYLLGGPLSALVATLGIFLPSFLFVALSAPLLPRLRRSPFASHFLDGVSVASLAIMALACLQLAHTAIVDPFTILVALLSAVFLIRFRLSSVTLILCGAACGLLHALALGID